MGHKKSYLEGITLDKCTTRRIFDPSWQLVSLEYHISIIMTLTSHIHYNQEKRSYHSVLVQIHPRQICAHHNEVQSNDPPLSVQ